MKPGQTVYCVDTRFYEVVGGKVSDKLTGPGFIQIWGERRLYEKNDVFEIREAAETKLTELINDRIKALEIEITELKSKLPQQKPAI